jgi:hypothetical protein
MKAYEGVEVKIHILPNRYYLHISGVVHGPAALPQTKEPLLPTE